MRLIGRIKPQCRALTLALGVLSVAPVAAADIIAIPTSTAQTLPLHDAPAFDWNGFYAGIFGGAQNSAVNGMQWGGGVQLGVNARIDDYLLGSEIAVQGLAGGLENTSYGQILGRAGFLATDDILIYGAVGYGIDLGPPTEQDILLGGGLELAVTDSLSLRAQYLHGFPVEGGSPKDQLTLGANFHF